MPWGQLGWDVYGKSDSKSGFGQEKSTHNLSELLNTARSGWLNEFSNQDSTEYWA
jgi:hypothetical protein